SHSSLGFWAFDKLRVQACELGTPAAGAACSANLSRGSRSDAEQTLQERTSGQRGPRLPPPGAPRPGTHAAEGRRVPPSATGCELQIKVPVRLGGEPAARAAAGERGWERGERGGAPSLPTPDDPRPQKSKRAEEKLQLLFFSSLSLSLSRSLFFF
uniref:Uncharacterized protein n=1 Tax=Dromaius novaehollandiae TaxID=8790 RepID=A0A8C4JI95_DRONO